MTRWALSKVPVPMLVAIAAASMLQAPASAQGFGAAGPPPLKASAQQTLPRTSFLLTGKIITVNGTLSIAQAVAIRG